MDAAQLSGLGQALALDHRLGVIEATLLLAQMPHRRFAQRLERAPAALAVGTATARPSGPNQRISRLAQCGRPWLSTRSTLAVPSASSRRAALAAFARRGSSSQSNSPSVRLRQRLKRLPPLVRSCRQSATANPKSPQPASNRLRAAGKPAKLALTAVMRKLLVLANALLKDNRTWTPKIA
jgi:hypothetical protein